MAGKLSAAAIESGTLSASKLDASLNTSFNNYQPVTGITITDVSYTNANANIILTGKNFDENCEIYIIGDNSIKYTNFTRTNANSISLVYPLANLSSLYTSNAAQTDDYLRIQVKNPDSSVAVSTIRIFSSFQGTAAGYISGGFSNPPTPTINWNLIERFSFASVSTSFDVGDLTQSRNSAAGQSSDVSGYSSGGTIPSPPSIVNTVDKFPFSSDANATDVGDLTQERLRPAGQSSTTSGYSSGGFANPPTGTTNIIDKFPFSSDANAADVGDLTQARNGAAGQSSQTNGYSSGGTPPSNVIDKFPFASDANATDVGDLSQTRATICSGQSSTTHGYSSGGYTPAPPPLFITSVTTIDRFSFASDGNASFTASLSVASHGGAGISSTDRGFHCGGFQANPVFPAISNRDERQSFSFASGAISSAGTILNARGWSAGQQS
jgi:hypothetical protein